MNISSAIMAGVFCITAVSFSLPAQALFFNNGTGLSSPTQTITFDEFAFSANTPITNQYSSLGVTFSGLFYRTNTAFPPNVSGKALRNFNDISIPVNPISIKFNTSQNQAAFALVSTASSLTVFTALLNGSVVATSGNVSTNTTSLNNNFYGFSGITFDEIRVVIGADATSRIAIIDNIQTGASTPVPFDFSSSSSLFILGGLYAGKRLFKPLNKA